MERKLNFNAGPAELPGEVLHDVGRAIHHYKRTGLSILELPHRSEEFIEIVDEAGQLVRELCGLGEDYDVMWLHGGGRMQFAMLPMNLLAEGKTAAYIESGLWAKEAIKYAQYYGNVNVAATSEPDGYNSLPAWPAKIAPRPAYLHMTTNNTIHGTQWHEIPATNVPLVADMSSDIFGQARDYTRFAMFYATAQKNLGVPGLALAVIHKDMLQRSARDLPPLLSYREHVKENSIVNTANVFAIYTSLLMLRWTKSKGLQTLEQDNRRKAAMLYDLLDSSAVFRPRVTELAHRSIMNVCFTTTRAHEARFLALCDKNNIVGIKGHRYTGGFRVSLYNAVPVDAVEALVSLMREYERTA